jgi:hypothetical protein
MDREMRQELLELRGTELFGVPPTVEVDITLQPLQIRLLGAQREMARAHALARKRQELRGPVQVGL